MIVLFSEPMLQSFFERRNSDIPPEALFRPNHELSKTQFNSREQRRGDQHLRRKRRPRIHV